MSRPAVPAMQTSSAVEDALVRVAKARERALQGVTTAREMTSALRLLRRDAPEQAHAAAHEIRKATRHLLEELDRELAR